MFFRSVTLAFATMVVSASPQDHAIGLAFPLFDYPENTPQTYHLPSMSQSLELSKSFYQGTHYLIDKAFTNPKYAWLELAAELSFDLLSLYLPFGDSWLHEEWHRSVLAYHGIDSFNEIYLFRLFSPAISVSRVADVDLIGLKANHPADMIRLHAAGIEGQYAHLNGLAQERFFFDKNHYGRVFNLALAINSIFYVLLSTTQYADNLAADFLEEEGRDIGDRDFTGWDFTAWVYDLFRPEEPYQARGIHPSGVGINRYITTDDLTGKEIRFLRMQGALALLNLADPHLYGFNGIDQFEASWQWYARHLLTSFGYTVDITTLCKLNHYNLLLTLHNQANHHRYFPGLTLAVFELPLGGDAEGPGLVVDASAGISLQPANQRFHSTDYAGIYTVEARLRGYVTPMLGGFIAAGYKSAGWRMGYPTVEKMGRMSVGVSCSFNSSGASATRPE
ncbi:MAG: hypothetical protein GF398_14995 [Chitinivibrionales bacterium]|nr:hypothetical protein [Chitinivibrionales bacterium]